MLVDALERQERRRHTRFLFCASMTVRLKGRDFPAWDQCGYEHQRAVGHGKRSAVRRGHGDVGAGSRRPGFGTSPAQAGPIVWI